MAQTRKATFRRHYLGIRPWTRHSMVLLVAGAVYVMIGFVYLRTPTGGPTWHSLDIARSWLSLNSWAGVWMTVGVMAIVSAWWPPRIETWGYMALTALACGWGAFYILGVIFGDATLGAAASGIAWLLVAFLWWAISGLISPEKVVKDERG